MKNPLAEVVDEIIGQAVASVALAQDITAVDLDQLSVAITDLLRNRARIDMTVEAVRAALPDHVAYFTDGAA